MSSERTSSSGVDGSDQEITNVMSPPVNSMDSLSPYYLHPSDHPAQVFASELLNDANYGEWVIDMSDLLFAKNKFGFVDGSLARPAPDSGDLNHWIRGDHMVKGWLRNSMIKEIRSSVCCAKMSQEIWADIAERFRQGSAPRAYDLRRAISMLRQDQMSVSAYYTKLCGLWDEVQAIRPLQRSKCLTCDHEMYKQILKIWEKEQLYDFLMGLDDVFNTVKSQILSSQPMPSLRQAYHLITEEEQRHAISIARRVVPDNAAFHSRPSEKGNTPRKPMTGNRPKCTHCQKMGHTKDNCNELIGYPEGWKRGGRDISTQEGSSRDNHRHDFSQRAPPRAAQVRLEESPIPGFSQDQLNGLMKHFGIGSKNDAGMPGTSAQPDACANMAGLSYKETD